MRRMLVQTALIALTPLGFASIAEAHASGSARKSVVRRPVGQEHRVERGVRTGELSRGEAVALRKGQARIAAMKRQAMRDGRVTAAERARIARAQNQLSLRMWHLRHNGRTRGA
jgi:hypothetical protein